MTSKKNLNIGVGWEGSRSFSSLSRTSNLLILEAMPPFLLLLTLLCAGSIYFIFYAIAFVNCTWPKRRFPVASKKTAGPFSVFNSRFVSTFFHLHIFFGIFFSFLLFIRPLLSTYLSCAFLFPYLMQFFSRHAQTSFLFKSRSSRNFDLNLFCFL